MQRAPGCCKQIVSRVLLTAGEARGEEAECTTLIGFFDRMVADWRASQSPPRLEYINAITSDALIVSDTVLEQALFNAFDNALEASPDWVSIKLARDEERVVIEVRDRGPGFALPIFCQFWQALSVDKGRRRLRSGTFSGRQRDPQAGRHCDTFPPCRRRCSSHHATVSEGTLARGWQE
jgi:two-component system sensor histidine kinase RegB